MLNESVFAKVDASVRDLDLETKSGKVPTNGIAISELSETGYIFKTQSIRRPFDFGSVQKYVACQKRFSCFQIGFQMFKICTSCRSRQERSNVCLLTKLGIDKA